MKKDKLSGEVIFTNKARCRDCNRCVRVCPVKAIRITNGQAYVEQERCIGCGTCVRECPQKAKSYRNDIERAVRLVAQGFAVISLAPSFPVEFNHWEWKRLPSALRELGFDIVSETAAGAYQVARKTAELVQKNPDKAYICSACPAVVSYVEKYRPEDVERLLNVVSPMIAHAKLLRQRYGNEIKIVFVGPCVTKKAEAERPEYKGLIDCVLTFSELKKWLITCDIDPAVCEESDFDIQPCGEARVYPLVGGTLRTAMIGTDVLESQTAMVSGFDEVKEALDSLPLQSGIRIIEPLFCHHGCINGPGTDEGDNLFKRRSDILDYARDAVLQYSGTLQSIDNSFDEYPDMMTNFRSCPVDEGETISLEKIREVLAGIGQSGIEDELNCGSCGYETCRERAIAVIRGLAEPEMCIPYMRRMAEQRTDKIIETSPNGIVILDDRLRILKMNPAFKRFFTCSEATSGKHISQLMDPEPFERLLAGGKDKIELVVTHERYNVICHQILYKLAPENQYVGIFVNITNSRENSEELERLRTNTVEQAQEMLEHQIDVARKMASFLGESTAKGEALVQKLIELAAEKNSDNKKVSPFKPWDTNTAK